MMLYQKRLLKMQFPQFSPGVNVLLKNGNCTEIKEKYSEIFHCSKHRFLLNLVYENNWTLHIKYSLFFSRLKYIGIVEVLFFWKFMVFFKNFFSIFSEFIHYSRIFHNVLKQNFILKPRFQLNAKYSPLCFYSHFVRP